MRPKGQPPLDRIARVFPFCLRHRGGGAMTASARQRPQAGATFAEANCRLVIWRRPADNRRGASSFARSKELAGRRPQRPGNQPRSRASLDVPPVTACAPSPATAGSAAIMQRTRNAHVSLQPTLQYFVAPCNTKTQLTCAHPVDEPSSLWKPLEKLTTICARRGPCSPWRLQPLTLAVETLLAPEREPPTRQYREPLPDSEHPAAA